MELSLEGKSALKEILDECCAYRCHGVRAGAGKMLGGKCGGPHNFCRPSVPWGQVLFSGAVLGVKSVEALQSCPGVTCKWICIYSGSWDEQGLLGSAVVCRAAPRGTN